jgi:uncharacterized membrane protein
MATSPKPTNPSESERERGIAVLSYIWLLFLIPLLLRRESTFARFHAKQGMVLFVIELLAGLVPVLGWIVWIAAVIGAIYGITEAWRGRMTRIPLVADIADKFKL